MLEVGFNGLLNFCGLMDISSSAFSAVGYYSCVNYIYMALSAVVETVFKKPAQKEQQENREKGLPEDKITVSGDGSWPKRGFTALLGLVILIGKFSNKIIDVIVKCKICQACNTCKISRDTPQFDAWYTEHCENGECTADHTGSAGLMEVEGVKEMFSRSIEKYNLMYEHYIGDGDTKTFKQLVGSKPYGDDVIVKKKECVLHVKKRLYKCGKEAKKQLTQIKKAKKSAEEKAAKGATAKEQKN